MSREEDNGDVERENAYIKRAKQNQEQGEKAKRTTRDEVGYDKVEGERKKRNAMSTARWKKEKATNEKMKNGGGRSVR